MNPIFNQGTSPAHRLILVLCCSVALIFFDHKMASFETARGYLQSLVSPLQYMANAPKQMMTWASENIVIRQQLMEENKNFRENELFFHEQVMQLSIVRQENERLRSLLSSPVRGEIKKMFAEILSVDSDPYSHQVVINRGANDGVYEGQPVLDEKGIVGQILHVGVSSSRVILISDISHAIPVRIQRNGLRLIASGSGQIDRLIHNFVPHSADVKEGDLLVTSGLGGKYPEGYPVSRVVFVRADESREFATIYSEPVAQIDRLRYMLLLSKDEAVKPASPLTTKKATVGKS
ncbi:rod shape-determining protein MreC [Colwellia psychrerythraea]|uniref:Cell shape-determining protein MreC n=1 Tax=Colwellia psychrerythraea (strain 34H / ATCC BAA-681) TaxID=167879 RepID=Q47VG5_COLP3|nr:rod shape-determining protein MreC [Colwellia psychrerythraea]AAZ26829.1 rod shape-determining protein MreC [Colwellia psychrerythraea 34H]